MPRRTRGSRGSRGKSSIDKTVIVIAVAALFALIGIAITLKETWSSPSWYGGRTSGSNHGLSDGQHKPPFSDRSLLLPYPSYEYSFDTAHNIATNDVQQQGVYRHLNEPNVMSYVPQHNHQLGEIAPLSYSNSLTFAQNHYHTNSVPTHQQFYVKNRLGDPSYSVHPDFHVPTYEPGPEYRRVGVVFDPNHPEMKMPLFGKPKVAGGNRFHYFVKDNTRHKNPMPLDNHNGLELLTNDVVRVPGYSNNFQVYVYYDADSYTG